MPRNDKLDILHKYLFTTEEIKLSPSDKIMLERVKSAYTVWLDKPTLSEASMRDYLIANFKISKVQALQDLAYIRILLGNVQNAGKEFYRYKVNNLMDEAAVAAVAGNHAKAKSLTKIAEIIIKNNRCDQDDGEKMSYGDIVPVQWDMSVDPAIAGVNRSPEVMARAEKLRKKYMDEVAEDIECEDGSKN